MLVVDENSTHKNTNHNSVSHSYINQENIALNAGIIKVIMIVTKTFQTSRKIVLNG